MGGFGVLQYGCFKDGRELCRNKMSCCLRRGRQPGRQMVQKDSGSIERDCCTEDGPQGKEERSLRLNSLFCLRLVGRWHW